MAETGTQFVLLAFAAGCLVLSIRHFQQKGFLWNNAWLFASEQERKHMDKAPHYRQSAIVFALLFLIFLLFSFLPHFTEKILLRRIHIWEVYF